MLSLCEVHSYVTVRVNHSENGPLVNNYVLALMIDIESAVSCPGKALIKT